MTTMKKATVAVLALIQLVAQAEGKPHLRSDYRRNLQNVTNTTVVNVTATGNGTEVLDGGLYIRDANDTAENPGSIIWTGQGNNGGSPSTFDDITCFSGAATVEVIGVGRTAMKDLKQGDRILTGNGKFEQVFAFAHRNPERTEEFVAIYVDGSSQSLELSHPHMVFLEGHSYPVRADAVKVGSVLRGGHVVTSVDSVQRRGIYAPLTKSGTLVVNGVLASAYVAFQESSSSRVVLNGVSTPLSHHDYVHLGLAPFRVFCGLSVKFCDYYNHDGMPPYVQFSIWLTKWVYEQNVILQAIYLVVFLLFTLICTMLETIVATTPGVVMATALLYLVWRSNSNHQMDASYSKGEVGFVIRRRDS